MKMNLKSVCTDLQSDLAAVNVQVARMTDRIAALSTLLGLDRNTNGARAVAIPVVVEAAGPATEVTEDTLTVTQDVAEPTKKRRRRRRMSTADRKAVSRRMKKYWADRRSEDAPVVRRRAR
jgi:hypothetical protein